MTWHKASRTQKACHTDFTGFSTLKIFCEWITKEKHNFINTKEIWKFITKVTNLHMSKIARQKWDVYGMYACTWAGRSQFRRGRFCGCCLVGAGTEQLHIVGRKPTDLTLLSPGLKWKGWILNIRYNIFLKNPLDRQMIISYNFFSWTSSIISLITGNVLTWSSPSHQPPGFFFLMRMSCPGANVNCSAPVAV